MDDRFDALARWLDSPQARRRLMRGIAGAGAFGLAATVDLTGLARRRKKRGKKPRKAPPLTCADQCDAAFGFCLDRPTGAPLCGDGYSLATCPPCSSDQDCLATPDQPYCITSYTVRHEGVNLRIAECGDYSVGVCLAVSVANSG